MDSIRLLLLTGSFLSVMLGGLYVTAAQPTSITASSPAPLAAEVIEATQALPPPAPSLPTGIDVPADLLDVVEEDGEVLVDVSGVRMGPLALRPATQAPTSARSAPRPSVEARSARRPARPRETLRLDADPGRNVILTARGMIARRETVRGSCYAYLTEVFDRAGNEGWRTRTIVHQAGASGPYADLNQIRPGDWLYIVTNPDSTPIGAHSVLFLGWVDRSSGYARTISHPGWAAGAHAGREGSHDVSMTYRIIRPRMAE